MKMAKTLKLALAAISAIALISTAEAASFTVTSGATTINAAIPPNVATGTIDGFTFELLGAINTSLVNPALDIAGMVTFNGVGPATITLCIMGDGFAPVSPLIGAVGGSFGGNPPGTPLSATIFQTLLVNGVLPGNSTNTVNLNGTGGFHSDNVTITPAAAPFSLEDCVTITFNGPGFISFDAGTFRGVPDSGATAVLLGIGLLAIGGVAKFRTAKVRA
jgi:VPDSG-CTERM motif